MEMETTRNKHLFKLSMLATALAFLCQNPASATNGYFSHGNGSVAKAMGGAATAMTEDSFGGANNPASMVWVGNRFDAGVDWFQPSRSATRSGAAIATLNGSSESESRNFLIPEIGYNRMSGSDLSFGVSAYGNGGLNTTYLQGSYNCGSQTGNNMLCGVGTLGVDMMQLIVAPTVSAKLGARHSVGLSLLIGYQRFKADGLQAFDNAPGFPPFTGAPGSVTNNGYDSSRGVGFRIGYLGRFGDSITLGAAYAGKMNMSKFAMYRGLFSGAGDFDIPENYSIGVAFRPSQRATIAFDYQHISYGQVRSIGTASMPVAPLGASNGPGFGWKDIDVFKLGGAYKLNEKMTVRAGYNHGGNPIGAADVSFNILAPGVVQNHYTLGMSYAVCASCSISVSAMHAPRRNVSGKSLFNGLFAVPASAGGDETIGMSQNSVALAWSRSF